MPVPPVEPDLGSVMLHHDSEGMGNGPLLCGKLLVCLEPFELVGEAGDDHVRVRYILAIELDVGDLPDLGVGVDSVNWLIINASQPKPGLKL